MDILNKLLLKDLQEIAKVMEIEVSVGQKKDELKKLISEYSNQKTIIMTTQVPQEGSDVGVYEVGKRISSISYLESHNMTTEATVTKIMWILGNFDKNFETVKKLFYTKINNDMIFSEN